MKFYIHEKIKLEAVIFSQIYRWIVILRDDFRRRIAYLGSSKMILLDLF